MDLPLELLQLILQRVSLMDDLMNCRATCRSWRKAADAVFSSQPPLMLFSLSPSIRVFSSSGGRLKQDATLDLGILSAPWSNHDSSVFVGTLPRRTCNYDTSRVQSVQGWLMFNQFHHVREEDKTFSEISFLNPFSRARFELPKLFLYSGRTRSQRDCQVRVVFNSAPPGSEDFVVVFLFVVSYQNRTPVALKQRLAFIKFKQCSWIEIEIESMGNNDEILYDIAVDDDDKLYGLTFKHTTSVVFVLNLKDHHHERLVLLNPIEVDDIEFGGTSFGYASYTRRHRLAMDTSTGELLLVCHDVQPACDCCFPSIRTVGFRVYTLERSGLRWCEVFDIGDRFLLWDDTASVSVVSAKGLIRVPEQFRRGNCIIFCNLAGSLCNEAGSHNKGVFFLADRTIIRFPIIKRSVSWESIQDMWFTPAP